MVLFVDINVLSDVSRNTLFPSPYSGGGDVFLKQLLKLRVLETDVPPLMLIQVLCSTTGVFYSGGESLFLFNEPV